MRLNYYIFNLFFSIIKVYETINNMGMQPFTNSFNTIRWVLRDLSCVENSSTASTVTFLASELL